MIASEKLAAGAGDITLPKIPSPKEKLAIFNMFKMAKYKRTSDIFLPIPI